MRFRSGKMKSGQSMTDSSQSTSSRVRNAGKASGMKSRKSGPSGSEEYPEPLPSLAPVLDIPSLSLIAATTATGTTVTTNSDGTFYWVVDALITAPSVAQMKLGQDSTGAAGDASGNAAAAEPNISSITGLVSATAYYLHCYQESIAGGSAVVTSAQFTTL